MTVAMRMVGGPLSPNSELNPGRKEKTQAVAGPSAGDWARVRAPRKRPLAFLDVCIGLRSTTTSLALVYGGTQGTELTARLGKVFLAFLCCSQKSRPACGGPCSKESLHILPEFFQIRRYILFSRLFMLATQKPQKLPMSKACKHNPVWGLGMCRSDWNVCYG